VAVKPVLAIANNTRPAKNQQATLFFVTVFSTVITSLLFWLSREITALFERLETNFSITLFYISTYIPNNETR